MRLEQVVVETEGSSDEESETESFKRLLYTDDYVVKKVYRGKIVSPATEGVFPWYDHTPGERPTFDLYKIDSYMLLEQIGKKTFDQLRKNISARCVGMLMLLAYNLRDAEDKRVFGNVDPKLIDVEDVADFITMDDSPLRDGQRRFHVTPITQGNSDEDIRKRAIGYCYLAASYMRLYTKPADNYMFIAEHLKLRFLNYYPFGFPFSRFHPDEDTVKTVKTVLHVNTRLRNTFYNFVYAGERTQIGRDLKDFLYVVHISYTGIHAFQLFMKCMSAYKVTYTQLTDCLISTSRFRFQHELDALSFIFTDLYQPRDSGKKAQMWRFARIFDNSFMNALQTKDCVVFVCTLAYLYKMMDANEVENRNVMNIFQVKNATKEVRNKAHVIAKNTRDYLEKQYSFDKMHRNIPEVLMPMKKRRKLE